MNLSRFQIHPLPIDQGVFGVALKALDTVEKRDVCLKMINSDLFDEYKEIIFKEIEMLQKLDHPNIVKCFGCFDEDDKFYIVFEYVEKGDLKSYLRKNKPPLSEETVLSFLSQLVSALSYAHSFAIIHSDLRPANILLTKDDKIKIIDFNSAKMAQTLFPNSKTLAGTPGYASLEILTQGGNSFPADVFSLGCVIYELMTGKPPFFHKDNVELRKMLETQKPLSIEGNYSRVLKFIVMEMLKKNPDERITLKEIQSFLPSTEQSSFLPSTEQSSFLQLQTKIQNLEEQNAQFQIKIGNLEKEKFQFQEKIQNLEREKSQLSNQNLEFQTKVQIFQKPNPPATPPPPIQNPSISSDQQIIEKWIGKKNWQLLYKATRDGFKASDFHSKCDNQGPTVSIITSKEGYIFGGYASLSWNSSNKFAHDSSKQSFLFTLTNPYNIPPTKYPLIKTEYAIYCGSDRGPCFGGCHGFADIFVSNQSNQNTKGYTSFSDSYSDTTGKGKKTFTGNYNFSTKEIEVFKVSD